MPLLSVLLEDARDMLREGDGALLLRLDGSSNKAALDLGDRHADGLAFEHFVESGDKVVARRLVAAVPVTEAIVDTTAIDDLAAGDDDCFGSAFGPEFVGGDITGVLEDGERQLVF